MKNLRIMAACGLLNLVFPALLLAQANLGNPPDGSIQNGPISFSGFTCSGTTVEIDVDGTVFTAGYPTTRDDTATTCGNDGNNGFSLLFNVNLFGDGEHTARLLVDGVEVDQATFTVVTIDGQEFVTGLSGKATAFDFPELGSTTDLVWQESTQGFTILSITAADGEEIELDEAKVFIEFHSTDTDSGIQFFWDGEPWTRMGVTNENGDQVLNVKTSNNLTAQGLAEAFFESGEPTAAELPMAEFLARFPAGIYTFRGETIEGDSLVGETEFTHTLPAPPTNLSPAGDDVVSHMGFTASFDPVTTDLDGGPLDIELYELVVEKDDDEPILQVFHVILRPGQTSVEVPEAFLEPDTEYKLEVIAQEESGNRTITETGLFTTDSP